jgi:hypothetical protein
MIEEITMTKGDDKGTIESLINYLKQAKKKGATHYKMRWSNDPMWSFKWFETYRIKTEQEIKQEKIDALEKELNSLKG